MRPITFLLLTVRGGVEPEANLCVYTVELVLVAPLPFCAFCFCHFVRPFSFSFFLAGIQSKIHHVQAAGKVECLAPPVAAAGG